MTFFSWLFKKCGINCELERYNRESHSKIPLVDDLEKDNTPPEIRV